MMLQTPRLQLRDVVATDRDGLLAYWSRADYLEHSLIDPPTTASVDARIARALENHDKSPRLATFLVAIEKRSELLVGEAFLTIRHVEWSVGEIGWGIHGDWVGRGLATEIGLSLLTFGFGDLGLHRIQALCRVENAASRRIMNKLGMREEGVFRGSVVSRGVRWSSIQSAILVTDEAAATYRRCVKPSKEEDTPIIPEADQARP